MDKTTDSQAPHLEPSHVNEADNVTATEIPTKTATTTPSYTQKWLFGSICVILTLMALVVSGVALHQVKLRSNSYLDMQTASIAQLNEINQALSQQQQAITQLTQQQRNFSQQLKSYKDMIATISAQKPQPDDATWQLKQAYNLLRLAQFNLHWNHDVTSSLLLLKQADQHIKELELPDTLEIRQTLATEITQLEAIPTIDKLGLMSKLSAISQQISLLPLNDENYWLPSTTPATEAAAAAATTTNITNSGWRNTLQQSWEVLKKIVVIRQHNHAVKPLLSPQQRRLLDDRIVLLLQQAQWAILQPDPVVFRFSLEQAIIVIKQNFAPENAKTAASIKQLSELKQQEIAPQLPEITAAELQLKKYIDHYNKNH